MDLFGHIVAATQTNFERQLLEHPLSGALRSGRLQRGHYIAWLRESFHLTRHTPAIFKLAAARVAAARPDFRDWLLQQAEEESGHDQLCVADLRRLGTDTDTVLADSPGAGAWGLITQDYYFAGSGNPLGLLGTSSLSEQLGATVAWSANMALRGMLNLPTSALGFLTRHGIADRKHFDDAKQALQTFVKNDDVEQIIHARRMAIAHCAQLLTDVLERPA
jgi:hypothetical protein